MRPVAAILAAVLCLGGAAGRAAESLQRFDQVVLVPAPGNDGDSFRVRAGTRELSLRLYFVDCCETAAGTDADARRLREQTRYFGLPDAQRTIAYGNAAREFTAAALAQPFTVHTAFARAMGRSDPPRVYAFVTTAEGEDLATLLVSRGLARARGVGRAMPEGTPRDEQAERFRDLEAAAMLKRIGVWAETNPDRIAELRAQERREARELDAFLEGPAPSVPLDINRASREELEAVPGLRPEWVEAILAGRPFARLEDLLRIRGIGEKTLERLRERLTVGEEP